MTKTSESKPALYSKIQVQNDLSCRTSMSSCYNSTTGCYLLFGGYNTATSFKPLVEFNPRTLSIREIVVHNEFPSSHCLMVATACHNNVLYSFGGVDGRFSQVGNTFARLDLNSSEPTWECVQSQNTPIRRYGARMLVIDDVLYLTGGSHFDVDVDTIPLHTLDMNTIGTSACQWVAHRRDPSQLSTCLGLMSYHSMVQISPCEFVIVGGLSESANTTQVLMAIYNTINKQWRMLMSTGEDAPDPNLYGQAIIYRQHSNRRTLVCFGGFQGGDTSCSQKLHEFDLETNCWTRVEFEAKTPPGVGCHQMFLLDNNYQLIIIGGQKHDGQPIMKNYIGMTTLHQEFSSLQVNLGKHLQMNTKLADLELVTY